MPDPLVISIDAMGGDHGPSVVAPGVARAIALLDGRDVRFLLHGDEAELNAAVARLPALQGRVEIRPSERVVANDEKPARAMRRGKGTSMWNAIESVKTGEAHAAVSSGNTGALSAISILQLRMIGEMQRPALVASWPTLRGVTTVLDVGANIDCDAERLVQFAILGAAYHRAVHGSAHPTVGVLNVGSEEEKGHEEVKGANRLLRATQFDLQYHGFVEGDDIAKGTVDVIVTDGFTGNVALKTAEGLARFFSTEMRAAFTGSLLGMIGAFIAQGALRRMRERLDPGGGGPFLGLNGIVVKSHGGADARGFAAAIRLAVDLARSDFAAEIDRNLKRLTAAAEAGEAPTSEAGDAADEDKSGERSSA
ncbi:MAG: phosphate acyltransferase PlsX [Proteobacteria bacterium]|nr:phosphate acyltransferase PlsX [Pseudomonadota bacterium]